jgi:hypothetical protein
MSRILRNGVQCSVTESGRDFRRRGFTNPRPGVILEGLSLVPPSDNFQVADHSPQKTCQPVHGPRKSVFFKITVPSDHSCPSHAKSPNRVSRRPQRAGLSGELCPTLKGRCTVCSALRWRDRCYPVVTSWGVHGALASGIPGLKSETWGTLRVFPLYGPEPVPFKYGYSVVSRVVGFRVTDCLCSPARGERRRPGKVVRAVQIGGSTCFLTM